MRQIILGTAGHIDHGKTSLIKILTGIDTDRLKEEKERGITIELGFAHFTLPNGTRLGIVDVPGHEKFVHHMVAGATGMDIVALVIAADEGVMPQTREHLEICKLLEIPRGIIVITKIDLVDDPGWIELVEDDVRAAVKGTFLEDAPLVRVSSQTGQGLEQLVEELLEVTKSVPERSKEGPFRLPVDRVFTIKGFGTIVTGTSSSGVVKVGDPLVVYPSGLSTRARSLQVHGESVEEAGPGQRVAINLQGLEKTQVQRGEVVAPPEAIIPSQTLDVFLKLLDDVSRPLKHGSLVRFHTGTSESLAKIFLLEGSEAQPGEEVFAQIHVENPVPVIKGDRFILRSYSPVMTVGGGVILNPLPRRHKRKARSDAAKALRKFFGSDTVDAVLWHLEDKKNKGIAFKELQVKTGIYGDRLLEMLEHLEEKEEVFLFDRESGSYVGRNFVINLEERIKERLSCYHKENPLRYGISKDLLYYQVAKDFPLKVYYLTLERLMKSGAITTKQELVKLSTHSIILGKEEKMLQERIEKLYLEAGFQPPSVKEIAEHVGKSYEQIESLLMWMQEQGIIVKVKEDIIFHSEILREVKKRLVTFLSQNEEISPTQFKELTGTSRKYAIPLLEYFDREKLTLRVGDVRKLR